MWRPRTTCICRIQHAGRSQRFKPSGTRDLAQEVLQLPWAGHEAKDSLRISPRGMRDLRDPLQLFMSDRRRKEQEPQDRYALLPQILSALGCLASMGCCVEAVQEILIVTYGVGSSRQRRCAGAVHDDRDEPSLVQAVFLVMEATQTVDARKQVTQRAIGVFARKTDDNSIPPSRVDDLTREVSPSAGLTGPDPGQDRLHRLPEAVCDDFAKSQRRRTRSQVSVRVQEQVSSPMAM